MEIALGIFIGVSAIEALILISIGMVLYVPPSNYWREHRKETTDRLNAAWQVDRQNTAWQVRPLKNGEGEVN
jgi:hypothetical protein